MALLGVREKRLGVISCLQGEYKSAIIGDTKMINVILGCLDRSMMPRQSLVLFCSFLAFQEEHC